MPSEHYAGIDSTEDICLFPGVPPRNVTRIIHQLKEHEGGRYTGWIKVNGCTYDVEFILGTDKCFRVISERGRDEQHNQD